MKAFAVRFLNFLEKLLSAFFRGGQGRLAAWLNGTWLAALYLGGILHWGFFFNWGNVPSKLHDWTQTIPYFNFLRRAALHGLLPLHMGSTLVGTDRYIAHPDTLLSPQAYLLRFLTPGPFMLVNTLILFTAGCVGLLLLRRRYRLAPAAFGALFLLFNFNGHITAHLAVGHSEWVGYFLLPFFVLLVLKLVEGETAGWGWVLGVALTLFFMFLQGTFHFVLWCLIFLAGLGVFYPKFIVPAAKAILFTLLLGLIRILPAAIQFIQGGPAFISGFTSVTDMFSALAVLHAPSEALSGPFSALPGWEVDTYLGLIGTALLAYFGVYQTLRRSSQLKVLLAPALLLAFFSIGRVFQVINRLPLPLTDSERVPSRFLILPVVVLVTFGCIQLQRFLDERSAAGWREQAFSLALLVLLGHDLMQHSRIWRVSKMYTLFTPEKVNVNARVINHPDPVYFAALGIGLAGSLITLGFLIWMMRRENENRHDVAPGGA